MNWNLNCRNTRRLLALSAGNDVEERDLAGVQRHLAVCPSCREVWQGLRQSQRALEQVVAAPVADPGSPTSPSTSGSVWPAVSRHLRTIDAQVAAPDWRGWLPSAALAAACLAVIMVALPEPVSGPSTARRRDLPPILWDLTVGVDDTNTLSKLPIERFRAKDGDEGGFGDRFPQSLPIIQEPRSF